MKKLLAILLLAGMMLMLGACGKKTSEAAVTKREVDESTITAEYEPEETKEDQNQDVKEKAQEEENAAERAEFEVLYEVSTDGTAEVIGFAGEGNQITISSSYDGHDVVRVADHAFQDCAMLEQVYMWADIKEIGDFAFQGCTALKEIDISSETTRIGERAFDGCTQLETLYIWGSPDIGEYAFANCSSLTEINIGSDTENVGAHAFEGCTGATALYIWSAEIIGDYAFAGCSSIEDVSIPGDTRSVGNHAFDGCTALTSVYVWGDDTAIGEGTFANCPNLTDVPAARGTVLECTSSVESAGEKTEPPAPEQKETSDGLRPEFKEAMDSYEAFFDEYCDFLEQYKQDPSNLKLLAEYSEMLTKLSEMEESFGEWKEEDMSKEELAYYLEVSNRITQKLLVVS